jgi:protein-disulfide isomerase
LRAPGADVFHDALQGTTAPARPRSAFVGAAAAGAAPERASHDARVCYRFIVLRVVMTDLALAARLAVATALALAAAPAAAQEVGFDAHATYRIPLDDAPARGARDALVTIVEFSDFNCRFCRIAGTTVAEILRLYPSDVRLVYRHKLLDAEDGTLAAEAAMAAADQGRFWPFYDRLLASDEFVDRALAERAAREVGLDMDRFARDLDSGRFRSAVREQDRRAEEIGVEATPVFFVNGRPLSGAQGLGTFIGVIEEERSRAAELVNRGVARRDVYHRVASRGRPRAGAIAQGAEVPDAPRLDAGTRYQVGLGDPSQRRGSEAAPVTLIEFADYRCHFCAKVEPILVDLARAYGGKVRFVYRHMPLGDNPESRLLAEATMAAGEQGTFWAMHDRLFAVGGAIDRPALEEIARELGVDMVRFRAALDQGRFAPAVSRDLAEASRLGVRGTPTIFINGLPIVGAKDAETYRAAIDRELGGEAGRSGPRPRASAQ